MSDGLIALLITVGMVGGSIAAGLLHLHLRKRRQKRRQQRGAMAFINFANTRKKEN